MHWNQLRQTPINRDPVKHHLSDIINKGDSICCSPYICIGTMVEYIESLTKQQELWSQWEAQSQIWPKASMPWEQKKNTKLAIKDAQCFEREKKKVKSLIKMVNKNNQSDRNPNKYERRNYIINWK